MLYPLRRRRRYDRPYFLAPNTAAASEAFVLLRDGMRSGKVVAIVRAILFRRVRSVLIRPHDDGQPKVKGLTIMVNSQYNGWRFEDLWLEE